MGMAGLSDTTQRGDMPTGFELKMRLVRTAGRLLATEPVDALSKAVRPDVLAAATSRGRGRPISRPTCYRAWPSRIHTVVDVARYVNDPQINGVDWHLTATKKKYEQAVETSSVLDTGNLVAALRDLLGEHFLHQLARDATITGWLLQCATMQSARVWRGRRPESREMEAAGQQVLGTRGALYEHLTDGWSLVARKMWAAFGRRPRPGLTAEKIVMLMQSLFDGCLLRMVIDPELNDPEISEEHRASLLEEAINLAVDAIFEITWAYTEPDRLTDPRRPTSNPGKGLFDVLVEAADAMYDDRNASSRVGAGAYEVVSPEDAAGDAGLPAEAASILFASQGDLVDSVLRHLVARDGLAFDMVDAVRPAPVVRPALAKLKDLAQTHPRALAAAQAHPPTHPSDAVPFLQELTGWITSALQSPHVDRPEPARIAETLVQLALTGDHGWSGVETILAWVDNVPSTPKGPESTPRARSGQRQRSAVSDITSAHVGPA